MIRLFRRAFQIGTDGQGRACQKFFIPARTRKSAAVHTFMINYGSYYVKAFIIDSFISFSLDKVTWANVTLISCSRHGLISDEVLLFKFLVRSHFHLSTRPPESGSIACCCTVFLRAPLMQYNYSSLTAFSGQH